MHSRADALILLALLCAAPAHAADRYIRVNQLGYASGDPKIARLLSHTNDAGQSFQVLLLPDSVVAFSGTVAGSGSAWGSFGYVHPLDFTTVKTPGRYCVKLPGTGELSLAFAVADSSAGGFDYASLAVPLLQFFSYQRCGPTGPVLHGVCHLQDAVRIVGGPNAGQPVDVTGGWHDAGDYLKFLTTESYAVELLLLAEEIHPWLCGDGTGNVQSDLLDEALIGVRHLLKLHYAQGKFLYQVQGEIDHEVGNRMPENDPLAAKRPAYYGVGKNHLGRLAAALARAARVFATSNAALADSCRAAAIDAYASAPGVPDVVSTQFYSDSNFKDKLGLAAIELYLTTGQTIYLTDAKRYSDQAGPGYWFGWDTLNGLLNALLAPYHPPALAALATDVATFANESSTHPFGMCATETWGVSNNIAGEAALMLLYERVSGNHIYANAAFAQRDFLLGTNPWGVCMVGGLGAVSPHDFHHQVADIANGGALSGSLTEGPAPQVVIAMNHIQLQDSDEYAEFQASRGVYHDDRNDYVTNEPTLTSNASALLCTALLAARGLPPVAVRAPSHANARVRITPNPARGAVRFVIAGDVAYTSACPVKVSVLNVDGRCIARLATAIDGAGNAYAAWDGRDMQGRVCSSGMYWVESGTGSRARMVWLR
jgi:hypothetical protein